MSRRALFEAVEPRRLFTVGAAYTAFGDGAFSPVPSSGRVDMFDRDGSQVASLPDGRVMVNAAGILRYLTPQGTLT